VKLVKPLWRTWCHPPYQEPTELRHLLSFNRLRRPTGLESPKGYYQNGDRSMTDDLYLHWKGMHTALFCNLYRVRLYGGTQEDYEQTRWDIARRCGVRRSTVDGWVGGGKKPSGRQIQTLIDIAVDEGFIDELVEVFERLKRGGLRLVFRGLYGTRDGDFVASLCSFAGRCAYRQALIKAAEEAKRGKEGTRSPTQGQPVGKKRPRSQPHPKSDA
jgi:hypothetical protein